MLYEIQPTGPARRLATQQVGYDQKEKSAVQRRRLPNTHTIISSMASHEFNVILRTTTDGFNVLPRTLARVVTEKSCVCHIMPILSDLHWPPVCHRINFNCYYNIQGFALCSSNSHCISLPLFHGMCQHDHYNPLLSSGP